ncbi:hypothetical protein ANN_05300 [Periplaneta americana]|uniref:Uncharacterized protein n=1 Tax=Periplaneta americana TaxID=6978 RepID=A0ABQ8TCF5_PERAM|nr:hypothetical protein ANN_05300 [Periplaneta americana]
MSNSEETADNSAEKKPENEEKSDEIPSPDVETRFTLDITATNLEDKNKEEEEEGRNEEEGEDKTDLAPADFYLFTKVKSLLKGRRFASAEEVKIHATHAVREVTKDGLQECFEKWHGCWQKCVTAREMVICHLQQSLDNDARPGRPKTSIHEHNVKLVAAALQNVRRATCEDLSEGTGISPNSVFRISTKNFKKRKISARWVLHCLTAGQEQKRLDIANFLTGSSRKQVSQRETVLRSNVNSQQTPLNALILVILLAVVVTLLLPVEVTLLLTIVMVLLFAIVMLLLAVWVVIVDSCRDVIGDSCRDVIGDSCRDVIGDSCRDVIVDSCGDIIGSCDFSVGSGVIIIGGCRDGIVDSCDVIVDSCGDVIVDNYDNILLSTVIGTASSCGDVIVDSCGDVIADNCGDVIVDNCGDITVDSCSNIIVDICDVIVDSCGDVIVDSCDDQL